jgi:hypothetical protein
LGDVVHLPAYLPITEVSLYGDKGVPRSFLRWKIFIWPPNSGLKIAKVLNWVLILGSEEDKVIEASQQ